MLIYPSPCLISRLMRPRMVHEDIHKIFNILCIEQYPYNANQLLKGTPSATSPDSEL